MDDLLHCVVMKDESEVRGAGAELLAARYSWISSWKDEETSIVHHTLYFQTEPEAREALADVEKTASDWLEFGVVLTEFRYAALKKEDWAESWKIHFKTMEVSPRLVVRPSWEHYDAKPGQHVLVLDPGMSFGTGQHATTKSCMAAIDKFTLEADHPLSMLDAGSGTGILAIAAYRLGCRPVHAFDIDPDTLPVARENAEENDIPCKGIDFKAASLLDYQTDMQYDIVAANILSSALLAGSDKLLSMVKPGGRLILAGILASEYDRVRKHFEDKGCKQLSNITEKEWTGGSFLVP